jgi:hypothetical protein
MYPERDKHALATVTALRHVYTYLEAQAHAHYCDENMHGYYAAARNFVHDRYVDACYDVRGLRNPRLDMVAAFQREVR